MAPLNTEHASDQIQDYVLGLLPAEEKFRVDQHVRQCAACRATLQREQQLVAMIRGTVQSAAQPSPARLAALRPAMPPKQKTRVSLYHQLAPVTLIAILFALGLAIQLVGATPMQRAFSPPFAATVDTPTLTATVTHTPTATLAALGPSENQYQSQSPEQAWVHPVTTAPVSDSVLTGASVHRSSSGVSVTLVVTPQAPGAP